MKLKLLRQLIRMSSYLFYSIFFQCLFMGLLMAKESEGQNNKSIKEINVSIESQNQSLSKVLAQIEDQTGFQFNYHSHRISSKKVNLSYKDEPLFSVLKDLAFQTGLGFKRVNDVIAVNNRYLPSKQVTEEIKEIVQFRISGKVSSLNGSEPLPGVSILIKGSSTGTTTDMDGNYNLEVNQGDILQFSFIGYQTQEVVVGNQSVINISLLEDSEQLEEVVVVGYGSVKKSDLTGSVASVGTEAFDNQIVNSLDQGLQGRIAGVQVVNGSSQPGGGVSIRVRGSNSISGSSEPLYVIDGLPIASGDEFGSAGFTDRNVSINPLAAINPNNIESIEILKDASATAIYGSRGSNGVVLITTKRGKSGKPTVSFDASFGIQALENKIDVFNASQFNQYLEGIAEGLGITYTAPAIERDIDWQDEIYRTAPTSNYNISASGGTDIVRYAVTAGYQNQDGILEGSGFDRYSFSSNVDVDIADWLTWGSNISVSRSKWEQVKSEGDLFQGSGLPVLGLAIIPAFPNTANEDGTYPDFQTFGEENGFVIPGTSGFTPLSNPLSLINENEDITVGNRIFGNTFLNFQIAEGLSLKTSFGADLDNRSRDVFESALTLRGEQRGGFLGVSTIERSTWINENILTYTKTFGNHDLTAVGGYTVQQDINRIRNVSTSVLANELTRTDDLSVGTSPGIPNSDRREALLLSYLGRVNYSYLGKYLITLSGRYDGSSKFAENNKWGFFPSAALAWRIIEEPFMANIKALSDLKLRASWGITGNQSFVPYTSLASLSPSNYVLGGSVVPGFQVSSVNNPNLKWEATSQIDIGFDASLFDGRVNMTFDYYRKETNDLILNVPLPAEVGALRTVPLNVGSLENEGIEFAINAYILPVTNKLQWNVGFNISHNQNKVLELATQDDLIFGFADQGVVQTRVVLGEPIGSFYGFKNNGLYNDQEELDSSPSYDGAEVGTIRYQDINGDGSIDENDRTAIGDPEPDFIYGITSNLSYGNFSLDLLFQGVKGGDIWNLNNRTLATPGGFSNKLAALTDSWTPSNTDAKYPKQAASAGFGLNQNDLIMVEDASFLRLRQLTLGYNFPEIPIQGISSAKVFFTASNLFTITDYTGYNPDVNVAASTGGNTNAQRGIDLGAYPLARTFIFGFNINF